MKITVPRVTMLLCAVLFLLTGCAGEATFEDVYYPTASAQVSTSGSLTLLGTSLEELFDEAAVVVIADVTRTEDEEYVENYVEDCLAEVTVTATYKGAAAVGDALLIREIGARDEQTNTEYSLDGVPLLHEGMRVLLFLREAHELPDGRMGHTICGEYQGKFFFDTDGILHESAALGAHSVAVIEDIDNTDFAQVTQQLQDLSAA